MKKLWLGVEAHFWLEDYTNFYRAKRQFLSNLRGVRDQMRCPVHSFSGRSWDWWLCDTAGEMSSLFFLAVPFWSTFSEEPEEAVRSNFNYRTVIRVFCHFVVNSIYLIYYLFYSK